jgi:N-acyl-D-amino-acid deacylase
MRIPWIFVSALLAASLSHGQIPDFTPPTPLLGAVLRNDADATRKLLKQAKKADEERFFGNTPLIFAVMQGNLAMTEALLDAGADPKGVDRHGSTPLMWAVGSDVPNPAIVELLLQKGADPNTANKFGETALDWALRRGDLAAIERLQAAGALSVAMVRRAVEKAVALLQTSGAKFVQVSKCGSCHHQSLPQMAYGAARDRGFAVNAAVSREQVQAVVRMFSAIQEQMEKGSLTLPNPGITVSYSLLGLAAEGYAPDALTRAMTLAIRRTQQPDGRFGVLPLRAPLEASSFSATALSIRALELYAPDSGEAIAQARAWLIQAKPVTQEDRAMRLLGLVWAQANAVVIEQAAAEVKLHQRPDGGWAQLAGLESDAYATGQALVALREAKALSPQDPTYRRGVAYLLRTQFPDGSWHVRTRSSPIQPMKDSGFPHGRDQWISAAGTSWAVIALSMLQPATSPAIIGQSRPLPAPFGIWGQE